MTTSSRSVLSILTLRHPAFWERTWKHRLGRIMIFFAIAYLAILIILLLLEDQFLYGPRDVELDKPPAGVEVENIDMTSRGEIASTPGGARRKTGSPNRERCFSVTATAVI